MRVKMAALAGAAVALTLVVMLLPTYAHLRGAFAHTQGERLVYLARATALELKGDSLLASDAARELIRRARTDNANSFGPGNGLLAIELVSRDSGGRFHLAANADREGVPATEWSPPDRLAESVAAGRVGATGRGGGQSAVHHSEGQVTERCI